MPAEFTSLILVPGGRTSEEISSKLQSKVDGLQIVHVDQHIRRIYATEKDIDATEAPPVKQIAYDNSVDYVRLLWEKGLTSAVEELAGRSCSYPALMMFPVWYGARRHERYWPINPSKVVLATNQGGLPPVGRVLFLFDDIYDMAWRHSQRDEYWDTMKSVSEFAPSHYFEQGLDKALHANTKDLVRLESFALSYRLHVLRTMLEWRRQDLVVSRSLAAVLECQNKFLPFAVKQLTVVAAKFLTSNYRTVYLSHPISEPRRKQQAEDEWPDKLIKLINELPSRLLERELLLIMPTAIDELRLKPGNEGFLPELTARWPIPADTLYSRKYDEGVECNPDFAEDAFSPKETLEQLAIHYEKNQPRVDRYSRDFADIRLEAANQLLPFAKAIEEQIGERDNAIVLNTDSIFVYRPLFGGRSRFSAGVHAELEYWRLLRNEENKSATLRQNRRCVIFHCIKDVEDWLSPASAGTEFVERILIQLRAGLSLSEASVSPSTRVRDQVVTRTVHESLEMFKSQKGLDDAQTRALVDENATAVSGSPLAPQVQSECRQIAQDVLRNAARKVLASFLTGWLEVLEAGVPFGAIEAEDSNVLMVIRGDEDTIRDGDIELISRFLRGDEIDAQSAYGPEFDNFVNKVVSLAKKVFVRRWRLFEE